MSQRKGIVGGLLVALHSIHSSMPILSIAVPPPPSDVDARELALRFVPTRTNFSRIANLGELQAAHGDVEFYAPSPLHVGVLFRRKISSESALRIDLEYEGESPSDPEIDWKKSASELVELSALGWTDAVRVRAVSAWKERVEVDVGRELDNILRTAVQRIETEADPVRKKQRLYFCELDHATNPTFLTDKSSKRDVVLASAVLMQRVIARRSRAPETVPDLQIDISVLKKLSALQIQIAYTHFGRDTNFDVSLFEAAYIAFARGTLRQGGGSDGIPNSAFFFLFAEFAFHAIDAAVDADVWLKLLPVLVHSQQLYVHAFPPYCDKVVPHQEVPIDKRRFDTYMTQAETPRAVDQALADAVVEMIRTVRGPLTLLETHAENARQAFPLTAKPFRPCNVLREPTISHARALTMNTWDLRALLENMATEISDSQLIDSDVKFLALRNDLVEVTDVAGTASELPGDAEVIAGPLQIVANLGTMVGWYQTPMTTQVLVNSDMVTVVVPKVGEESSRVDEYPTSEFDAFLVLIPKP